MLPHQPLLSPSTAACPSQACTQALPALLRTQPRRKRMQATHGNSVGTAAQSVRLESPQHLRGSRSRLDRMQQLLFCTSLLLLLVQSALGSCSGSEQPTFHLSITQSQKCSLLRSPPRPRLRDLSLLSKSITFCSSSAPAEVQSAPPGARQPPPLSVLQILLSPTCKTSPAFYYGRRSKSLLPKAGTERGSERQHVITTAPAGPDSQRGPAPWEIPQPRMLWILSKTRIRLVPAGRRWLLG